MGLKRRGWLVGAVEEELAETPVKAPHGGREKATLRTRGALIHSDHLISKLRFDFGRG